MSQACELKPGQAQRLCFPASSACTCLTRYNVKLPSAQVLLCQVCGRDVRHVAHDIVRQHLSRLFQARNMESWTEGAAGILSTWSPSARVMASLRRVSHSSSSAAGVARSTGKGHPIDTVIDDVPALPGLLKHGERAGRGSWTNTRI